MIKKTIASFALLAASVIPAAAADKPVFPGGDEAMKQFISENMKYPAMAKENGVEGIVNVAFTVKADGSIGSIKIVRMIDPDLEQEAIRIVKSMPKWTPADNASGQPVDATATIAIPFILSE